MRLFAEVGERASESRNPRLCAHQGRLNDCLRSYARDHDTSSDWIGMSGIAIGGREVGIAYRSIDTLIDECDFCGVLESHPSPLGATSSRPNGRLLQPL